METLPLSSARRLDGVRAYGRAADAFETVAWRPPSAARFDTRVAHEPAAEDVILKKELARLPGWVVIVSGGVVAALMGAMLGAALQL